ncbi:fumarylacetoacetate hydrolase family protein [Streptomyces iranensis]|uniref:2-keto-4-pentenoate hydratase/2-oxohepta-3-ene-1,7-dioic acid hydratase in catechol pathway n=1 Tax=Streptomyces iranensis TaxID=576784 RepID=A0A061A2C9_9ACTN|nr:fumarylacetoacetate hydrolase family protein [Streptomyces iranensis]MBP2064958.1 2-keto-4-pentenoate hydratase/2-oxohepta-3-ene-1,7-dioic acid hydratase in catechol pathway [Streptomyces iranensis]CDR10098.1 5-carboxymethyl-2-hydroxymuconate delta-isomerase [Streptomyces iranensis]
MKLVAFTNPVSGHTALGRLNDEDRVEDLSSVVGDRTLLQTIDEWERLQPAIAAATSLPVVDVDHLRAPIPQPRRNLFAVGKNYRDHVEEFGRSGYDQPERSGALPTVPIVFTKVPSSVTGPYDAIDPHRGVTSELDYEAELAVIIGRGGRGISRQSALDHVWGYTIINDVTARDLQRDHQQWMLGKSLDTFAPMGPWAVTADEVGDPTRLVVSSTVNGEPRQHASVADLIFDIPELISVISAGIMLQSGDIIATGTPAGVGVGFTPPRFLKPSDIVECSITGMGSLRNTISGPA